MKEDFDWKNYEKGVLQKYKHRYEKRGFRVEGTNEEGKHRITGRFSNADRQLDVAVYHPHTDELVFVIDAKNRTGPVNLKEVETFLGMMRDIDVKIGGLVAPDGYTEGAKNRTKEGKWKLELLSRTEAWDFNFLPTARAVYPYDAAFHVQLSKALCRLDGSKNPSGLIEVLEPVHFEEWQACMRYGLQEYPSITEEFLEFVAKNHHRRGWRWNSIKLLDEAEKTQSELLEYITHNDRDPEIREYAKKLMEE